MKLFFSLLALFAYGVVSPPAPAVELPDSAIQAYLKKHGIPQLQVKPGTRFQRDVDTHWLKWFQRIVIDPFIVRLREANTEAALLEKAATVAQKGIMQVRKCQQRDHSFTPAIMVRECAVLIESGVNDPLIHWLHCRAIYENEQDYPASEAAFKRAVQHEKFAKMPAAQRLLTMDGWSVVASEARRTSSRIVPRGEDIIEAAWQSLQEKSYLTEEDEILEENLRPIFGGELLAKNEKRIQDICKLPSLSDWVGFMFSGRYHERKAWQARGHQYADKVTAEEWEAFSEFRTLAVQSFVQAWKLRPDIPVAARELLGIGMTGTETGENPMVWLQRVNDTQFDHISSFRALMNGLLPRWGGSHGQMLAFGLSCAATKQFDTDVPYFFFEALRDVIRDGEDWTSLCRDPLLSQVALALCRQRVRDARSPEASEDALALLGAYGWLCGDYKTAVETLSQVKTKFSRTVVKHLIPFDGWHEQVIRSESILFAAGFEDLWRNAERAMQEKDLAAAEKNYVAIRAKITGEGARIVDTRLATVKFERALTSGEWVPLHVDPSLAGWQIQRGDWTGTSEGNLVNQGQGASAFIFHLGRVGTEFEIRGSFEAGKSGLGILIGHGDDEETVERWITCMIKGGQAYFLDRFYRCDFRKEKLTAAPSTTSFLITCRGGKTSLSINGNEVFTDAVPRGYNEPHAPLPMIQDGHVGFCGSMFYRGNVTTIFRSEVRLLAQP
jgi:hypothetical protein